ncbi:hypothetical protein K437DRAFT_293986 [Tilletiaria anomala UBC 951]|uniref:Zn(2)-C6 fungal-type domain-containing protein n=1 Tax=Tilletiaria anomala (strain ATCC 24038 / CBS 436.72 / UBC 951) TaxID=1037660 RepID=A0A066WA66_TILAU|nr:uncharacterized protein K437DRAFT_293986 [Tilletiaria anomala UBC 951]KDN47964.1 hypothetical protein K437DRAFT_293986 [Tilletiaria anomala UBC 951]
MAHKQGISPAVDRSSSSASASSVASDAFQLAKQALRDNPFEGEPFTQAFSPALPSHSPLHPFSQSQSHHTHQHAQQQYFPSGLSPFQQAGYAHAPPHPSHGGYQFGNHARGMPTSLSASGANQSSGPSDGGFQGPLTHSSYIPTELPTAAYRLQAPGAHSLSSAQPQQGNEGNLPSTSPGHAPAAGPQPSIYLVGSTSAVATAAAQHSLPATADWPTKSVSYSTISTGVTAVRSKSDTMSRETIAAPGSAASGPTDTGADAGSSTGAGGAVVETTAQKRKRARQFKYLTDSPASGGAHDGNGAGGKSADGADGEDGETPTSRKKVKRACVFCQRSHMPCEVARPCARCTKRGIAHMCKDKPTMESPGTSKVQQRSKPKPCGHGAQSDIECSVGRARPPGRAGGGAHPSSDPDEQNISSSNSRNERSSSSTSQARGTHGRSPDMRRSGPSTRTNEEVEMLENLEQEDYRLKLPISLLLSKDHSIPTSTRRGTPAGSQERQRQLQGKQPIANKDGDAAVDGDDVDVNGGAHGEPDSESRGKGAGASRLLDELMDDRDKEELERLLEGGNKVFDLKDTFADKPTGLLSASLGVSEENTLATMIPWRHTPAQQSNAAATVITRRDAQNESLVTSRPSSENGSDSPERGTGNIFLREEELTAAALRGIPSYNYTWGYAKLAHWMNTRFSRESCANIDRALGMVRLKFLQISRQLSQKQLLDIEEEIYSSIEHYKTHVFEQVPFAMLLLRRTGEIYGANSKASTWLQLPKSLFSNGQLFHFQLVKEQDIVTVTDKYAEECLKLFREDREEPEWGPSLTHTMEIDRSLLLHDKPALDPRSGKLLEGASETLQDGSPSVLRLRAQLTLQARISQHGLPLVICLYLCPAS